MTCWGQELPNFRHTSCGRKVIPFLCKIFSSFTTLYWACPLKFVSFICNWMFRKLYWIVQRLLWVECNYLHDPKWDCGILKSIYVLHKILCQIVLLQLIRYYIKHHYYNWSDTLFPSMKLCWYLLMKVCGSQVFFQ